ncbi:MAG: hypothetical protein JWP85_1600 [Rhodoglobus sp.]|nr:hypothetical protein [Rhodoglobus sp.]
MTTPAGPQGTPNRPMLLTLGAVAVVLALAIVTTLIILSQSAAGQTGASGPTPTHSGASTSSTPAPTRSSTPTPAPTLVGSTPAPTRTPTPTAAPPVPPPVTPPAPYEGPTFNHLAIQPYATCEDTASDAPISFVWGSDQAIAAYIGIDTDDAKLNPEVSDLPGSGLYLSLRFPCSLESQSYTVTIEDAEGRTLSATGVIYRHLP